MLNEIENIKLNIESISNKQYEFMTTLNNDKSHLNVAKLENEINELKIDLIKNNKAIEDTNNLVNPD